MSWIGLTVDDLIVDKNLGEGAFSFVYKGASLTGGPSAAFKLAKEAEFVESVDERRPGRTNAVSFFTGGTRDVRPDAEELLLRQYEKLADIDDEAVVKVTKLSELTGLYYYRMEYLPGQSLRALLDADGARLSHFVDLAKSLDRLSADHHFGYHGDLKPENIIDTGSGLKLIDPGYFGPLRCQEGSMSKVAITTTCYYPTLKPDDLYAFGVMLWEAALGVHPLLPLENAADFSPGKDLSAGKTVFDLAAGLKAKIERYVALGYFGFLPLMALRRPRFLKPELPFALERVLLKGLGLSVGGDGLLDLAESYGSFGELFHDLENLQKSGIEFPAATIL